MTERTNIPITDKNRIFHTLHYNFTEDKIPLQYAFELNTLDLGEAEEKKKQIIEAITEYPKLKEELEKIQIKLGDEWGIQRHYQLENQKLKAENEKLKKEIERIRASGSFGFGCTTLIKKLQLLSTDELNLQLIEKINEIIEYLNKDKCDRHGLQEPCSMCENET